MDIKLISVDLDKTLLLDDETVSDYTVKVLSEWKVKGAALAVSTSRSYFSAREVCEKICPDAVISSGGVEAFVGEKCVYKAFLSEKKARECIELCLSDSYTHHITVVGEREDLTNNPAIPFGELEYGHYKRTDFSAFQSQRVGKISVFSDDPSRLCSCFAKDREVKFIPFCIGKNGHKLSAFGANKGSALLAAAEFMGIEGKSIISFGDDTPDVDMFSVSGMSIAMGNASDEVKRAAGFVCKTNEEDGVACFLEALL